LPPHRPRQLAVALGAVIVASVVGTICSVVPSMAFRSKSGSILYEYGLSVLIAPALFGAIVIVAARALRPSRKRLLVAAITILGASPFLFGIKLAREPWFDIDDQIVTLAPWAVHGFVISAVVLLAAGFAVLVHALRQPPDRGPELVAAHARIASPKTSPET